MQKADTLSQIAEQRSIKRMRYIGAVVGTVSGIFVWSFVGEDVGFFLSSVVGSVVGFFIALAAISLREWFGVLMADPINKIRERGIRFIKQIPSIGFFVAVIIGLVLGYFVGYFALSFIAIGVCSLVALGLAARIK